MKNKLFIFCALLLSLHDLKAQKDTTHVLDEVEVNAFTLKNFAIGSKRVEIDSVSLALYNTGHLSDILMKSTAIYLKEYGNGQLSSITFRGTGAERTAMMWKGMNVNSPSLGQSDFGTIHSFILDNLQVQYGACCTLYGSDAVGGTLVLGTDNYNFQKGYGVDFQQNYGSYGNLFSGLKASFASNRLYINTKLYRFSLDNDFPYTHRGEKIIQSNADVTNSGIVQNFTYKLSKDSRINLNLWHYKNDRGNQTVLGGEETDRLTDENTRLNLSYETRQKFGDIEAGFGYLKDFQIYKGNVRSEMLLHRYVGKTNYKRDFGNRVNIQVGANLYHIKAISKNYENNTSENRLSLVSLLKVAITRFWDMSLNARQTLVTGYQAPFTPSLGSELFFVKKQNHQFSFKTLFAKSYRVPTFNERYWRPGGNPDILPENGKNMDLGIAYTFKKKQWKLNTELTHFNIKVDNWIVWTPGAFYWSPKNIRKVHSRGFEATLNASYRSKNLRIQWGGNLAYTKATNQAKFDDTDKTVGNQLPYTPLWRWVSFADFNFYNFFININAQHTGGRYENLDNRKDILNFIPAYDLVNLTIGKNLKISKHLCHVSFRINNVFDKVYQNYLNRAMPKRNYLLSIKYRFSSLFPPKR